MAGSVTNKAVIVPKLDPNPASVLEVEERPVPSPGQGEVLVRMLLRHGGVGPRVRAPCTTSSSSSRVAAHPPPARPTHCPEPPLLT